MFPKKTFLSITVFLFSIFLYRCVVSLEPDFGWHVQLGNVIMQKGIPKTDIFSYTMSTYPAIDHEWLSNVFLFILYEKVGYSSVAITFACIALFALLISFFQISHSQRKIGYIFFLLAGIILLPFIAIKTQIITLFFFSLLIAILTNENNWKKFRFFIPLLFFLWVNMHGGFAIGVITLLVFFISNVYTKKKIELIDLCIVILSLGVTGITPYGYRIWLEVWMTVSDPLLRWTVFEWLPALFFPQYVVLWFFMIMSIIFVIRYEKQFSFFQKAVYTCLLFAGLTSVRHIAIWIIVALPMTVKSIYLFTKEVSSSEISKKRYMVLAKYFIFCCVILSVIQLFIAYITTIAFSEQKFYPVKEVQFVRMHPEAGNIFVPYDWGGYLDWKLPEKKIY